MSNNQDHVESENERIQKRLKFMTIPIIVVLHNKI